MPTLRQTEIIIESEVEFKSRTMTEEHKPCSVCHDVLTCSKGDDGEPLCTVCSNDIYLKKVSSGQIVELKIDMTRVRETTLMQIRTILINEYALNLKIIP